MLEEGGLANTGLLSSEAFLKLAQAAAPTWKAGHQHWGALRGEEKGLSNATWLEEGFQGFHWDSPGAKEQDRKWRTLMGSHTHAEHGDSPRRPNIGNEQRRMVWDQEEHKDA